MAGYVDGYVLPIPKKSITVYRKMAKLGAKVWTDHGALDYRECVAEDFNTFCGISFEKLLKLKKGETVVFAYVRFKSRAHRDKVNKAVMADPRLAAMGDPKKMPFDPSRMIYSGFEVLVSGK